MAVKNVNGHGVSTVAGPHNTHVMSGQPGFPDAPQAGVQASQSMKITGAGGKKSLAPSK